jgi:Uma2 family endonuclease
MIKALPQIEIRPVTLCLKPVINLTDDQLYELCQINPELRIERAAEGELLIMPPAGWETSDQNSEINMQLRLWAKRDGTGEVSESSGGFILPNGAMRSPDAAWVRRSRLAALTRAQRAGFLPLCPDFVIELRSPSDSLRALQAKMEEYIENGARLGWLLDPKERRVYIYRPQRRVERLENPPSLSGDPELPGFVLDIRKIWESELS